MKKKPDINCHDNLPYILLIANKDMVDTGFRKSITRTKAIIKDEFTPESRGDSNYAFVIENLPYHMMMMFRELDEFHIDSYTLKINDNMKADFKMDEQKRVQSIIMKFRNGKYKNGEERWSDRIFIYSGKRNNKDEITEYAINWTSIGTVSIDQAKEFAEGFNIALQLAKECTEQFVKDNQ